jgi:uncharacterized delta-60 repeat protein
MNNNLIAPENGRVELLNHLRGFVVVALAMAVLAIASNPALAQDNSKIAVGRYASNGSLDNSFSGDGLALLDIPTSTLEWASAVADEGNGQVVVAGFATVAGREKFAVARFTAGGALDASFNGDGDSDGVVLTDFSFSNIIPGSQFGVFVSVSARATAVAIKNGKIVVAGKAYYLGSTKFALARYNGDGSLDTTFGTGGKLLTDFPTSADEEARAIVIESSSPYKIVVVGRGLKTGTFGSRDHFALARYNWINGSLDATFDGESGSGNGMILTDIYAVGGGGEANAVAIGPDKKIVVAGFADSPTGDQFALARYNWPDGRLDGTFGGAGFGKVLHNIPTSYYEQINAIAITGTFSNKATVRIIVAGSAQVGGRTQFALSSYKWDLGNRDTAFGSDGVVFTAFPGSTYDVARAMTIDGSSRIVAAGAANIGSGSQWALARYSANGILDTTFDGVTGSGNGRVLTPFASNPVAVARAVAIVYKGTTNEKIVVAGSAGDLYPPIE